MIVIQEHRPMEIKGAGNTLLSLSEDTSTDEFIRNILYFMGCSLEHIAKEIEEDKEDYGAERKENTEQN